MGVDGRFVQMTDTINGGVYVVPLQRVNKALRHLHMPTAASVLTLHGSQCRCKRSPPCYERGLTTFSMLATRHTYFQQLDEYAATKYLADLVRPHNSAGKNNA